MRLSLKDEYLVKYQKDTKTKTRGESLTHGRKNAKKKIAESSPSFSAAAEKLPLRKTAEYLVTLFFPKPGAPLPLIKNFSSAIRTQREAAHPQHLEHQIQREEAESHVPVR